MLLGFVAVGKEGGFEFFGLRRLGQLWQGLQDLALGKIDVLQSIVKQIVECFPGHDAPPFQLQKLLRL